MLLIFRFIQFVVPDDTFGEMIELFVQSAKHVEHDELFVAVLVVCHADIDVTVDERLAHGETLLDPRHANTALGIERMDDPVVVAVFVDSDRFTDLGIEDRPVHRLAETVADPDVMFADLDGGKVADDIAAVDQRFPERSAFFLFMLTVAREPSEGELNIDSDLGDLVEIEQVPIDDGPDRLNDPVVGVELFHRFVHFFLLHYLFLSLVEHIDDGRFGCDGFRMSQSTFVGFGELGLADTQDTSAAVPVFGFDEVAGSPSDNCRIESAHDEFGQ